MPSLFTELRRRNVFKVGAAYAIVAWLLIEVSSVLLPTFNAPEWIMQVFTLFVILGFPLALILAWAFDLTPQGIKAASDVRVGDAPTQPTGFRFGYISQGLILLAVGFLVVDQYFLEPNANVLRGSSSVPAVSGGLQRWAMELDEAPAFGATGLITELDVSPDGSHIAYATGGTTTGHLYIRALDQFEPVQMIGTQGARRPFFSDDSEWVAYSGMGTGGQARISVLGGPPQMLQTGTGGRRYGGTWLNNEIIISQTEPDNINSSALYRLPANGGLRELLISPDVGESFIWPDFLPDGEAVLFTIRQEDGAARDGRVAILSLATLEHRTLVERGYNARYAPTGHIVFARTGSLWAVPFDLESQEITGAETPVVQGVQMDGALGGVPYGFSDNGLLVYARGGDTSLEATFQGRDSRLVWVTREGVEQPVASAAALQGHPRLSPDGQRAAITRWNGTDFDIHVLNLVLGTSSRLTVSPGNESRPLWTPDGQGIVYALDGMSIFHRAANGTGEVTRLVAGQAGVFPETFTSDGTLIFRQRAPDQERGWNLRAVSLSGGESSRSILDTLFDEGTSSLSPDGRWLAYVSNETGRDEIYVRPYPDTDGDKIPVSVDGGNDPLWSPDGTELFFRFLSGDRLTHVMRVAVTGEVAFSAGAPELLFTGQFSAESGMPRWDISPDGLRFLMLMQESPETSIAFVNNWFEELNRLAPPSP